MTMLCQRCKLNSLVGRCWIMVYRKAGKCYRWMICDPCHTEIDERRAKMRAWQHARGMSA